MFSVWCEWDIGVEDKVFSTWEVAVKHAKLNLEACNIEESFEELKADGYIGIDHVEIITE